MALQTTGRMGSDATPEPHENGRGPKPDASSRSEQETDPPMYASVLPMERGLALVPVTGHLRGREMVRLTAELAREVRARGLRAVVIDVSGVHDATADGVSALMDLADALRLVGAATIVAGAPTVLARRIVDNVVNLVGITFAVDAEEGIRLGRSLLRVG